MQFYLFVCEDEIKDYRGQLMQLNWIAIEFANIKATMTIKNKIYEEKADEKWIQKKHSLLALNISFNVINNFKCWSNEININSIKMAPSLVAT